MSRKLFTQNVLDSAGGTSISVLTSADTVYTQTFDIEDCEGDLRSTTISHKTESTGTRNVAVVLEQSFEPPLIEGSAHPSYVTINTLTTASSAGIWVHQSITPVALPYGRIKLTGGAVNSSSTVTIKLTKSVIDSIYA